LTARELQAQQGAERRAAELEGVQDPHAFDQADAELTGRLAAARHEADQAVGAVVLGSERRFAEVFASAQELLGPPWPLATLPAVPMPAVAQHA
jgi:hypothetical protein